MPSNSHSKSAIDKSMTMADIAEIMSHEKLDPNHPVQALLMNNKEPSKLAVVEVQRLLVKPMQEKELLELEIQALEMQIKELKAKRRKVDKTISCYSNVMSPMRRIPADILREIFFHCLDNDCNHALSTTTAPMLLTHVCSSWRSIALSSPLLWARMNIIFDCLHPKPEVMDDFMDVSKVKIHAAKLVKRLHIRCEMVEEWLRRSGACPLSFSLLYAIGQPTRTREDSKLSHLSRRLLKALVVEAHRWQNVELTMPVQIYVTLAAGIGRTPLRNLTTLRVSHHNQARIINPQEIPNSELVAPNLKTYSLHVPPDFLTKVASPWATLTHLSLHSPISPSEASKILARCLRLVHLKMVLIPVAADRDSHDVFYPPLHLPELRALYVSDQALNVLCSFYDSFVVPQLRVLSYHSKSSSTHHNGVGGGLAHVLNNLNQILNGPVLAVHPVGHVSANLQVHAPVHPPLNPPMHALANPPGQVNQVNPLGVNPQVNPPVSLTPFVNNHRTPPICRLISKSNKLQKLSLDTQFFTSAEISEILYNASSVKHLVYGLSTPPNANQWDRQILHTCSDGLSFDTKWNFRDVFTSMATPLLPNLETLEISDKVAALKDESLLEFIVGRMDPSPLSSYKLLKHVKVAFHRKSKMSIEEGVLKYAREAGVPSNIKLELEYSVPSKSLHSSIAETIAMARQNPQFTAWSSDRADEESTSLALAND